MAQPGPVCGTDETLVGSDPPINRSGFVSCDFDVDYVRDNCAEVYVKVNIHFILESDCSGTTASNYANSRFTADEAFQEAEDLLTSVNQYTDLIGGNEHMYHQQYWGATQTSAQCVPIKFVLNDVIIHCNSAFTEILYPPSSVNATFQVPYPEALNVVISRIVTNNPNQLVNGFAPLGGRYSVLDGTSTINFLHEIGHNLTLRHPHDGENTLYDNCADTWWFPPINWDGDSDGTLDDRANIRACWDNTPTPPSNLWTGDPCNWTQNSNLTNQHPCCLWEYQTMNVMGYGSYVPDPTFGFMTPCQMNLALGNLSGSKCDLIADINPGCPVPAAVIGNDPTFDKEVECDFKLNLAASMSDDDFRVRVELKNANGTYQPYLGHNPSADNFYNWTAGPATDYKIAVGYLDIQQEANTLLLNDREYRVTLEVRNLCGDLASDIIEFKTSGGCKNPPWVATGNHTIDMEEVEIYPNPFWDGTTLQYRTLEAADIKILTSGFNTTGTYTPPALKEEASGYKEAGDHNVNFANYELANGLNYIFIVANGVTYVKSVVKQ